MVAPERSKTRPTDPTGTGLPSSSTIASSTPATGRPTVVATSSSDDLGVVPVPRDASVEV